MTWRAGLAAFGLLLFAPVTAFAQQPGPAAEGERLFRVQGCYGCHIVGKFGTPIGPNLSHVGGKYSKAYLTRWLKDPESQRPNAHMPKLELDPVEVEALAAFLSSLQ
ncbi:MAG TPA: cytochrome c [Methylomirabilota bacterium]|jgi:cytochrome c2